MFPICLAVVLTKVDGYVAKKMKTLDELKRFYHQQLKPDLQVLERQRKAIANKIIYFGVAVFGLAGIFILVFADNARDIMPVILFPLQPALAGSYRKATGAASNP